MRLHVHAAMLGAVLSIASAARAQADAERWALVYTSVGSKAGDEAFQTQLDDLRAALQARAISVTADMAGPIEAHHSRPAIEVAPDRLKALREALDSATRHLALGELPDAREKLSQIDRLQQGVRDYLNREINQAQKVFSACVTMAYLLHKNGQRDEAEARMRACADTFPGFDLPPTEFSSGMRKLFHDMTMYREDRPVWLLVESRVTTRPCTVRLNGVDVGRAPLRMRAREGLVRVQLECSERPGRIYERELGPGDNALTIDPSLDRALRVTAPWVVLQYDSATAFERSRAHAIELGHALGASEVVQLIAGEPLRLQRIEVASGRLLAESSWSGRSADLAASLDVLLATGDATGAPAEQGRASARTSSSAPARAGVERPTRNATRWFRLPGASPVIVTAAGVIWALSLEASGAALSSRSHDRAHAAGVVENQDLSIDAMAMELNQSAAHSRRAGSVAFIFGSSATLLNVASSMLFLPEEPSVPIWAWTIGGIGLAALGVGAATTVFTQHCSLGNPAIECRQWLRDPAFGPLLMIHGAAPLSVGLTYLLERVFRTRVQAEVAGGAGFGMLQLGGRL